MPLPLEAITLALENTLVLLAEKSGAEIASRVRSILYANLERGRIQYVIEDDLQRVAEYVQKVTELYQSLNPYLLQVQEEKTTAVWEPLFKQLYIWAYNYLLRKNVSRNTLEIAEECATEATMAILNAFFPYDTDFAPWAHMIVQNTCKRFVRRATKKSEIPAQNIVALDEMRNSQALQPESEDRDQDLLGRLTVAIARLSPARQDVIKLKYFGELSTPEIAQRIGKSIGAVYSLQFNALQDLREILNSNRETNHA